MKNKINYLILLIGILLSTISYGQSTNRIVEGDIFPGIFSEKNYLINFGAEKNVTTGVSSTMTVARITSGDLLLHGLGSFQITPTAIGQTFSVSATAMMPRLIGANCQATLDYTTTNGTTTNYFASVLSGTTTLVSGTLTAINGTTRTADLFFPCPAQLNVTAATPQVSLRVTAISPAPTQSLVLDKLYLGKAYSGQSVNAYTYSLRTVSYAAVVGAFVAASGTLTVLLPTAVGNTGKEITITQVSTSGTAIVSSPLLETINGIASSTAAIGKSDTVKLISTGSGWLYADGPNGSYRQSFGSAGGAGTILSTAACNSSPCTIYLQNGVVNSVTRSSTGNYALNIVAGAFSQIHKSHVQYLGLGNINCTSAISSLTLINVSCTTASSGAAIDISFGWDIKGYR